MVSAFSLPSDFASSTLFKLSKMAIVHLQNCVYRKLFVGSIY